MPSTSTPTAESLRKYRAKRDFTKTAEPSGTTTPKKATRAQTPQAPRFLVQKHDASRLHYDFRLEIDGVLKSWAVPKGPSLDPKDKRLAVEVEDHPLDYGHFEGTIPHGEYGGGTVLMWDQGSFVVDDTHGDALTQWQKGRLAFDLQGERLRGRFHLVRVPKRGNERQQGWLLMKAADDDAVAGGDVDHLPATSVQSGRSLQQIASDDDATWHSDRAKKQSTTAKKTTAKKTTAKKSARSSTTIEITNRDRRIFGDDCAVTKGVLARYVEVMAPLLLPFIAGRPLSVVRCPEGIAGQCFFQKHAMKGMPEGIDVIAIDDEQWLMVDDAAGLVGLVQMGGIELHPWGVLPQAPEQPDRIIMDVDPADDLPWTMVFDAANELRERLAALGLISFVKSTGGKGLHVCAPLDGRASWDEVKAAARGIADDMERDAPTVFTANPRKAQRVDKIFVDYLRNGRGATAIAPYSPRARPDAPVSVPLSWKELSTPPTWTVLTVHERVQQKDPWATWFELEQGLGPKRRRPR
ncbi:MAG TPA: non-homologous end-joining DNA ligase [Myxococcota bacterium]